jgi:ELWxxDGT repeat protein
VEERRDYSRHETRERYPSRTELVRDIYPGAFGSDLVSLTQVGDRLFFGANDGTTGWELWRTDGTHLGARPITNYQHGALTGFTDVGGTLFFLADDGSGTTGWELWTSDGTAEGTRLVKDINPGPEGSVTQWLRASDRYLYVTATDGTSGYELWRSDGTAAGTRLVEDINLGSGDSTPLKLTDVQGTLFFAASDSTNGYELWRTR